MIAPKSPFRRLTICIRPVHAACAGSGPGDSPPPGSEIAVRDRARSPARSGVQQSPGPAAHYECYLTSHIPEAIASQERALAIRRTLPDEMAIGRSLRLLSRFCWYSGNRERAETHALRIPALVIVGLVRTRRSDPGASEALDEALTLALPTGELQRIGPVAAARAEAAWYRNDSAAVLRETERGLQYGIFPTGRGSSASFSSGNLKRRP